MFAEQYYLNIKVIPQRQFLKNQDVHFHIYITFTEPIFRIFNPNMSHFSSEQTFNFFPPPA